MYGFEVYVRINMSMEISLLPIGEESKPSNTNSCFNCDNSSFNLNDLAFLKHDRTLWK
jgi:hypothetical protein